MILFVAGPAYADNWQVEGSKDRRLQRMDGLAVTMPTVYWLRHLHTQPSYLHSAFIVSIVYPWMKTLTLRIEDLTAKQFQACDWTSERVFLTKWESLIGWNFNGGQYENFKIVRLFAILVKSHIVRLKSYKSQAWIPNRLAHDKLYHATFFYFHLPISGETLDRPSRIYGIYM